MKKRRVRDKFIGELQEIPIVNIACKKLNIVRQTYYRWREEDPSFATEADIALSKGDERINDAALSNVVRGIQNQDEGYTKYWLSNKHRDFKRPRERSSYDGPPFADTEKVKKFEKEWFECGDNKDKPKEDPK